MEEFKRRATVHDVARAAGVSLATVDRVLNGRPGVRPQTAEKVAEAIRLLDFRRDLSASLLARARDLTLCFVLPKGGNAFMEALASAITRQARHLRGERLSLRTIDVPPFDAAALSAALASLSPEECDCAVIVATEARPVREAVDRLTRSGVPVLTLVSDLPGSMRRHFVGIDNRAAGRTAASLLGRFCRSGRIGLLAGSLQLADHAARLAGFTAAIAEEFPEIELIGPIETRDDDLATEAAARRLLAGSNLAGLYNIGAGTAGLVAALRTGPGSHPHVVAHELTDATREGLALGLIDVIIDQNPDGEIAEAIRLARAMGGGTDVATDVEPIEIGLYLRDNLPQSRSTANMDRRPADTARDEVPLRGLTADE